MISAILMQIINDKTSKHKVKGQLPSNNLRLLATIISNVIALDNIIESYVWLYVNQPKPV